MSNEVFVLLESFRHGISTLEPHKHLAIAAAIMVENNGDSMWHKFKSLIDVDLKLLKKFFTKYEKNYSLHILGIIY